jgi:hypothetical protein
MAAAEADLVAPTVPATTPDRPGPGRVVAGAVLAAAIALAGCTGGGSRSTVDVVSHTDAATTLRSSAQAMLVASSYRFTGSVAVGASTTHVSGEFQSPNRVHEVITTGGSTVEVVFVGSQLYLRDRASGHWTRSTSAASSAPTDPRSTFGVLDRAEHVVASGGGLQFTLPAAAAEEIAHAATGAGETVSGTAVTSDRGITHLQFVIGTTRPATVTLDYTDIGHGPPVTQPSVP